MLVAGVDVKLPEPGTKAEEKDGWVIVLGGSGSVGAVAVQLARLAGYKSPRLFLTSEVIGPDLSSQLAEIKVTDGNFGKVFEASARGHDAAIAALEQVSTAAEKLYNTTNTWNPFTTPPNHQAAPHQPRRDGGRTPQGAARLPRGWRRGSRGWRRTSPGEPSGPLDYQLVEGKGVWEAVVRAAEVFERGGRDGEEETCREGSRMSESKDTFRPVTIVRDGGEVSGCWVGEC